MGVQATSEMQNWDREVIPISELRLDSENPRTADPRLAGYNPLERMLLVDGDACMELLDDIVFTGSLSPLENIICTTESGNTIVLEGNRRLTCLKAWADPSIISDRTPELADYRRQVTLIKKSSSQVPIEEIEVTIAPNRDSAQRWISLKHESRQGGKGVRPWTPMMQEYVEKRNNPTKRPVTLAYVEFLYEAFPNHVELSDSLGKALKKYTNLQRVLKKKLAHRYLGFQYKNGRIIPLYPHEALLPATLRLMSDQAKDHAPNGDSWSRRLNKNEDVEDYFGEFKDLWPENVGEKLQNVEQDINGNDSFPPKKESVNEGGTDDRKHPIKPSTNPHQEEIDFGEPIPPRKVSNPSQSHVFRGLNLTAFPDRIHDLVRQTSKLRINTYPEVIATVMRTIVDLSTTYYIKQRNLDDKGNLNKRIRTALLDADPSAATKTPAEKCTANQKLFTELDRGLGNSLQISVHSAERRSCSSDILHDGDLFASYLETLNTKLAGGHERETTQ